MGVSETVFSKIISKQIHANIIYEDDEILAFDDINHVAPIHVLVIPKKQYINFLDFISTASDKEVAQYFKAIKKVTDLLHLKDNSFRMITNSGEYSGQTIMYFHTHIIGGKEMKELL